MKSRGTATEKLADVIQMLQIARKTGSLTATRDGMDNALGQGTIIFHNGQIIDATIGQLRGTDAFNSLMAWQACHFVFQPGTTSNASQVSPVPSNGSMNNAASMVYGREPPNTSPVLPSAPYRIQQVNEILPYFNRLGLSRAHRQLFLLIDGKRTMPELVRLIRHRPEEVDTLLADLERAGLIRQ